MARQPTPSPEAAPSSDAAPRACTALPPAAWEAVAEALPDDIERLLFDADSVEPFQLDARLRAAVRALQRIDFQTGRLLR
ncbi:MAG: hypothetical protein E6J83_14540, partial [Deltaproteobacteria bacterium]